MRILSLLALALLVGALAVTAPSCKLDAFATPGERVALDQAEGELDGLAQGDQEAVQGVLQSIQALTAALGSGDPQGIAAAMAEAEDAMEAAEGSEEALRAALERYGEIERAVRKRAAETAGVWILPGLPPPLNGPLGLIGIQAVLMLAFDRSRQHLKNAVGAASRAKLAEAIKAAGKALGLLHTEPTDPVVRP
jgi:hypothetical protein